MATKPTKRRFKGKGARHHSTAKGKLVRVVLRDGTIIMGKFTEKNRRFCLIDGQKRIPWRKVRTFGIAAHAMRHSNPSNGTG